MRTLRQLCAACVLALALALSAFAGDMTTGVTSPPPPPGSQVATAGDITTGTTLDISTGVTVTDPATEVMLSLLQSLLSLF